MNLLILMYHRARAGPQGNPARVLNAHFAFIACYHANRMPGEPLAPGETNVCLCFDDGYYDFYAVVYPLLKVHGLRALLAIPPLLVRDYVEGAPSERLNLDSDEAFAQPRKGGFCTWSELEEMVGSGHVTLAARGPSPHPFSKPEIDLKTEVETPQTVLAARMAQPVESFVFPFGKYTPPALRTAQQRYRFVFGNGNASNRSWDQPVLYRINGDELASPSAPFSPARLVCYRARYWWHRLRRP